MTTKESVYTFLSKISKSLFIASVNLMCCLENDRESIDLAQFMLELHEAIDSFIDINCA